ncbi:hypothetical protein Cni_G03982 [Canna indica]|uniref:DYW domain-containing protein n=1 Tax=Canna indica TaxID=4628 RepID=A0AAQ3Q3J8_9LILI|nr:hypothetical protein Cni_G03982 [Canna indica]
MAELGAQVGLAGYDALLSACIDRRALRAGQRVHAHMIKSRFLPAVYLATRLLIMYVKCGALDDARHMLEAMPERNIVSWTAMISGYSQNGRRSQALELFVEMLGTGLLPNEYTLATALTSCTGNSGPDHGRQIHSLAFKTNFDSHIFVGSSLLDMYAKAGKIEDAQRVFATLPERDVVSCTAIISGYAQLGLDEDALELFKVLHKEGMECNYVTFASLLTALSGLAALDYGACRVHANVSIGEFVAQRLLDVEPENAGNYVILSNIYAAGGRWQDVAKVRELMKEKTVTKEPGKSWINLNKTQHTFYSSDRMHPQREEIFSKILELYARIKEAGYVPDLSCVLHDVDDEQKESILLGHSEKLAIAFGIMGTAPHELIRITKNLRICVDCHNFAKYVSKVYSRDISLRDSNRFHLIVKGTCTCGDYW